MPPRKGLWLKIAKKGSGIETVTYAEALDVALCYGWIDGQKDAVDDRWRLQRFTPPGAPEQVVEDQPRPGDRADRGGADAPRRALGVERARADGRWEAAYDSPSRATVPRTWPSMPTRRQAFFATLDRTNRYAIPYRIHDAKGPATRARSIKTFAVMLGRGEKPYP